MPKCGKCWSCWRSISTYPICWCGSENLEVIDDGRHIDTSLIIESLPSDSPGLEVIQLTAIECVNRHFKLCYRKPIVSDHILQ